MSYKNFIRYVLTFTKTGDTMKVYDLACLRFSDVILMPVPSQISKSCGLAIMFKNTKLTEIENFMCNINFSAYLYELNMYADENEVNHIVNAMHLRDYNI